MMSIPAYQIYWMIATLGLMGLVMVFLVSIAAICKKSVKTTIRLCIIVLLVMLSFLYYWKMMNIPPCQGIWMYTTLGWMGLVVVFLVSIAAICKKSVKTTMRLCIIVLLVMLPFLYWTRPAVYAGKVAFGDTAIGFPLVYAYGQDDAGLGPFYKWKLMTDASLGFAFAVIIVVVDNIRRKRKAQQSVAGYRRGSRASA